MQRSDDGRITAETFPLRALLLTVAGWVNREQQHVVEYLVEETRVLKEQLRGRRLRLTDDQRRRLSLASAVRGLIDFINENRGLLAGILLDVLGPLGDILDVVSAVIGKDIRGWVEGGLNGKLRSLSWWQRVKSGLGGALRAAGGAFSAVSKINNIKNDLRTAIRQGRNARRAEAAGKSSRAAEKASPSFNCFAAGTLVLLASGCHVPIEQVNLGDTVATWNEFEELERCHVAGSPEPDHHDSIDPENWRTIELQLIDDAGNRLEVGLLRPVAWLETHHAAVGQSIYLRLSQMGMEGEASVVSIERCPRSAFTRSAGGRRVTGRFQVPSWEVLEIVFAGDAQPLVVTGDHLIQSDDRGCWLPARELRSGERVRTRSETVLVLSVARRTEEILVHNLEVHRDHNYFVGQLCLSVHNDCFDKVREVNGIPKDGHLTKDVDDVFRRLSGANGIDPRLASDRLHAIKAASGLGAADNVILDRTGNVFEATTGELLGSLTAGGARRIR